jgi:hypothetical protein
MNEQTIHDLSSESFLSWLTGMSITLGMVMSFGSIGAIVIGLIGRYFGYIIYPYAFFSEPIYHLIERIRRDIKKP